MSRSTTTDALLNTLIPVEATGPASLHQTELGPLPAGWRVVRLGEVIHLETGKRQKGGALSHGEVWSLGGEHITESGQIDFERSPKYISLSFFQSLRQGKIQSGDTLVVKDGARTGKSAFVEELPVRHMAANEHLFIMRPIEKTKLWPAYLGMWTLSQEFWEQVRSAYHGLIGGINRKDLRSFLLPLPPLPEQRAIAHVLRMVQKAREATERVIAALRNLKRSLMRHLFTYGPMPVDAADQVALQDTPIGPTPAHWRVVRLGEVVKLRKGTVQPSDVPNARYVGLEHLIPGEIRIKQFSRAGITRSAKALFEKGDILYGKLRPYLDKAALAEWAGVCSTDILVLQPSEEQLSLFTVYLMHTSFVLSHAVATTTGVNHPRTSWKALSQALVPLPPLSEQRQIARILQTVDRKIEAEEARKQALDDLFRSLLHHLMTAKMRLPREFVERFVGENKR